MTLRILFALPGLHSVDRGAELAFIAVASELARGGDEVTLIGAGQPRDGVPYKFVHSGAVPRARFERMPSLPALRNDTAYEEASFVPGLLRRYRPNDYDLTVACSFPFVHWALRRPVLGQRRPPHVFVTQNGDWPIRANNSEYHFFACDGLICINPEYYARGHERWPSALIPNGVAVERFTPGQGDRTRFRLPPTRQIVLMVSAMIETKRVADGIRAVADLPDVHLVCAGDGPERNAITALADVLLPGRFSRLTVPTADMPLLYRACDAFLHLSLDEPFGNSFLEALACGLPVVAPDLARTRWIVGDEQFLCETTDQAALVASIKHALAAKNVNVDKRRAQAQQFSWSIIATQYRAFFEEVVKRY